MRIERRLAELGLDAARLTAIAILVSLQRALGDLDRVTGWLRVSAIGVAELPFSLPGEIEAEVAVDYRQNPSSRTDPGDSENP
jgi:hypothetical protein